MNEKIIFYLCALVFFIFGAIYFGTSYLDGQGSDGTRDRIDDCQNINSELQKSVDDSKAKVSETVRGLGSAETELDRAERAIERCEQILRNAEQRIKKQK